MKGIERFNEPLAPHTSWHVGGPASRYYVPSDFDALAEFLRSLPAEEPLFWLGLGSNVLIADQGLKGTVIHTLGMTPLQPIEMASNIVQVEASLPCAKLAKFCAKNGFVGGEFFAGIPGTIGGALTMNAGAFGGETWVFVDSVEVVNRQGELIKRYPQEYDIHYRSASLKEKKEEWFVRGFFRFQRGDGQEASERIKELLRKRSASQPIGVFSCGSVFKNPPNDHAGRLIEICQLKGFAIGDAEVSTKHANFIINKGKAKASEILQIIRHVAETVKEKTGVQLHTEVRLMGF